MPIHLYDAGNDVLRIEETDESGVMIRSATGWVSALTNHIIDDTRDENGNRPADEPDPLKNRRAMTQDEIRTYALGLLAEQNPTKTEPAPLHSFDV